MPMPLGQEQKGRWGFRIRFDEGHGLGLDGITELPALTIESIALASQRHRLIAVVLGQQIHHQAWIPQTANGIDAWCNLKADVVSP